MLMLMPFPRGTFLISFWLTCYTLSAFVVSSFFLSLFSSFGRVFVYVQLYVVSIDQKQRVMPREKKQLRVHPTPPCHRRQPFRVAPARRRYAHLVWQRGPTDRGDRDGDAARAREG